MINDRVVKIGEYYNKQFIDGTITRMSFLKTMNILIEQLQDYVLNYDLSKGMIDIYIDSGNDNKSKKTQ